MDAVGLDVDDGVDLPAVSRPAHRQCFDLRALSGDDRVDLGSGAVSFQQFSTGRC